MCIRDRALLCPVNGRSNPREWDITLIVFVIRNETKLKPLHGWSKDKPPPLTDITKGGCIDHAKHLRNELNHGSVDAISTQPQFDRYWDRIKRILKGLDYQNMDKFHELKTASLDKYNGEILCLVTNLNQDLDTLKNEASNNTNEIQNMNAKINMLEQTYNNLKSEVNRIKKDVESSKKENNQIRKDVESNKEENNQIRKDVESNKEKIEELKEKISEKKIRGKIYFIQLLIHLLVLIFTSLSQ